jgi:hypothetical protein
MITTLPASDSTNLNKFTTILAQIEQRHINWFKTRPAIFDSQEHDCLSNHTFTEIDGDGVNFNFWKYSELPENIKNDCLVAYNEVFGYKLSA